MRFRNCRIKKDGMGMQFLLKQILVLPLELLKARGCKKDSCESRKWNEIKNVEASTFSMI
jgi:hypothetical protein